MLLRSPEGDVGNQPTPLTDHDLRRVLAGGVVRPDPSLEHGIPAPYGLFPEWPAPRELSVDDHPLVSAPDIVHEHIEPVPLARNRFEHAAHLLVISMVATQGDHRTTFE